jgi:hypothetical protein
VRSFIVEADGEQEKAKGRGEKDRLRHWGGLEVEEVGLGGKDGCASESALVAEEATESREEECACKDPGEAGRDGPGKASLPEEVVGGERHHEEVWQRQPDGADLFVARISAVEEATGDVEVGGGVAVLEGGAFPLDKDDCRGADQGEQRRAEEDGAIRTP